MTAYFLCEVAQGLPTNCVQLPAEKTMQIVEMVAIIGALWAAVGAGFIVRLIVKQLLD